MADPLLEAIVAGRDSRVVDALRGRPEAERRPLADALLPHAASDERFLLALDADGTLVVNELTGPWPLSDDELTRESDQLRSLYLAVLGTATLTQVRRLGPGTYWSVDDGLGALVLLERRPSWLAQFAQWILGADMWASKWWLVRILVREGAVERPPRYLEGMIEAARHPPHAVALLENDPELLEREVWELFAFDGGEDSLRSADDSDAGWREAILACAADGRMPRERVLDATLGALARDLSAYRASWFIRLWRDLKPTKVERAACSGQLRALLGAAAAPVVSFAVEELLRCDGAPPVHELAPALSAPAKKTVRAALKLLDRNPDAATAAIALGHEAADVQDEVLGRLEAWGFESDVLLRHIDLLAATVRPRAEALLGLAGLPAAGPEAPAADELAARVAAVPEEIRSALAFGAPVPAAPVAGEPVLGEPAPAPIASLDELADALAAAMPEFWQNRDERLLDGILRHCSSREPFDGPLRPFVDKLLELADNRWFMGVPSVAAAWLSGYALAPEGPERTWERRLHAAARRAAEGRPAPLLALATHAGGWIEPGVLVERVRAVGETADVPELAQALLRLAPEGRATALAASADIPGRIGAVLRCALGGEAVEVLRPGQDGPAVIAARAAREPPLTHVRVGVRLREADSVDERLKAVRLPPRDDLDEGPVAELAGHPPDVHASFRFVIDTPDAWPARRDIACAGAIGRIGWNLGTLYTQDSGAADVLERLIRAGEPLPPLTLRLAMLALCSAEQREDLLAADLLIAAIEDGRADAPGLAPGLRADVEAGLILTNRLGERLSVVAAAGPLHRATVRELLDMVIDALAGLPSRTHAALLVPLYELCAQTGVGVQREAARAFLSTLSGSSKAAKAARSLLAREGEPPEEERALALAARLRRAERWLSG